MCSSGPSPSEHLLLPAEKVEVSTRKSKTDASKEDIRKLRQRIKQLELFANYVHYWISNVESAESSEDGPLPEPGGQTECPARPSMSEQTDTQEPSEAS